MPKVEFSILNYQVEAYVSFGPVYYENGRADADTYRIEIESVGDVDTGEEIPFSKIPCADMQAIKEEAEELAWERREPEDEDEYDERD